MKIIYSVSINISSSGSLHEHVKGIINSASKFEDEIIVLAPGSSNPSDFYKELNCLKTGPNLAGWFINLLVFDIWVPFYLLWNKTKIKGSLFYYRPHLFTIFQPLLSRLFRLRTIKEVNGVFEFEVKEFGRGFLSKIVSYIDVLTSKISHKNVVVTEGIKEYFCNKGVAQEKIIVVPNGVAMDQLNNNFFYVNTDKRLNLVFIGKLSSWQGIKDFIEFVLPVSSKYKFSIDILGDGEQFNEISKLIVENKIDNIKLHGWVDHKTVIEFLANSDICILPRKWPEKKALGSPLKLFEYMAMGKPIIATRVDGIINLPLVNEYIDFFDYKDISTLESIFEKYQDREKLIMVGKKLKKICEVYYTWDNAYLKIKNAV